MTNQTPSAAKAGAPAPRHRAPARPSPLVIGVTLAITAAVYTAGYLRTEPARQVTATRSAGRAGYRDGTYSGWGRSRHGRVFATVVIRRGRIASAEISDCRMKYPCSMIASLPPQVVTLQGANVDIVSGATNSTEAFSRAIEDALSKAERPGRAP